MPSSVIRAMRFDPMKRVLDILFHGARGLYRYFNVPANEWRQFRQAPSKGEYLNSSFKAHQFPYEKLQEPTNLRKLPRRAEAWSESELQWGDTNALPALRSTDDTQILQRKAEEAKRKAEVDQWLSRRKNVAPTQAALFDFEDAA